MLGMVQYMTVRPDSTVPGLAVLGMFLRARYFSKH